FWCLASVRAGRQTCQPVDADASDEALDITYANAGQEWSAAYDTLHADSRARLQREDFERLARQYRRALGFEPASVQVRSCEEQGEEAKAHVVFSGPAKSGSRQFRDSFLLRRGSEGWGGVLPRPFWRKNTRW